MYRDHLEEEKKRVARNKVKWQSDLQMQLEMKRQQKEQQIKEDNEFFMMTEEKERAHEANRIMQHKLKMDKYLGDYNNQKGVIKAALFEQLKEKDEIANKERERDQMYIRIGNEETKRLQKREDDERAKRLQQKVLVKQALEA